MLRGWPCFWWLLKSSQFVWNKRIIYILSLENELPKTASPAKGDRSGKRSGSVEGAQAWESRLRTRKKWLSLARNVLDRAWARASRHITEGGGTRLLSSALSEMVQHYPGNSVSLLLSSLLGSMESRAMGSRRKVRSWKSHQCQESLFSLMKKRERTPFGLSTSVILWKRQRTVKEGIRILSQFCGIATNMSDQVSVSLTVRQAEDYTFFPPHRVALRQKTFLKW